MDRLSGRARLLLLGLVLLGVLLAATGEGGGSIAVTLFVAVVVVWMVFGVLFRRRR